MMNANHEVISDFLDGEAFEPRALGEALADPAGRELLIDFVVLRYAAMAAMTHADEVATRAEVPARRSPSRLLLAAAAVFVALLGGYQFGQRTAVSEPAQAPDATRVVQVDWQRVAEEVAQ
jgi:hypothetical protein